MFPKKLFFIPGFMGMAKEGDFLRETFKEVVSFDYQNTQTDQILDALKEQLEREAPGIIYAYSMGGRLLLSVLEDLSIAPEKIFLESVGLDFLDEDHREARRLLDQERSQKIIQDFESFLINWYELPLWGLSLEQKKEMVGLKLNSDLSPNHLAQIIVRFSPGTFPQGQSSSFRSLFLKDPNMIYFAGEKDGKYCQIAKELATNDSSRSIVFSGVGHNIHYQEPQRVIDQIVQVITKEK